MDTKEIFMDEFRYYNVFDYCTEENRLSIIYEALERNAFEDFWTQINDVFNHDNSDDDLAMPTLPKEMTGFNYDDYSYDSFEGGYEDYEEFAQSQTKEENLRTEYADEHNNGKNTVEHLTNNPHY